MLYHGSPFRFERFSSPEETGIFRSSEANRRHHRDVVFLTNSLSEALRYAGAEGFLYLVKTSSCKPYLQEGKKKPRPRDGVFIAKPEDVEITLRLRLAPRRRGEAQEYILDN